MTQAKRLWEMDEEELAAGSLTMANCEKCQGTGLITEELEGHEEQYPCYCVRRVSLLIENAGFPERFQGQSLADLDWVAIQPADLVTGLRDYAERLECYGDAGIGMALYGNVGAGKTHVAIGMGKIACGLGYSVAFVTLADVLDELRGAYDGDKKRRDGTADAWRRYAASTINGADGGNGRHGWLRLVDSDWLILDDLGTENLTSWVREKLYQLVNERWLRRMPIIITSNCTPQDLSARLGEGVVSRLWGDGLAFHFQGEDYRLRSKLARLSRIRSCASFHVSP